MTSATVQINVIPKRLLKKREAAIYCGRSVKRFEAEVPFSPVRMANGDLLYDVQDCDKWIDGLKAGAPDSSGQVSPTTGRHSGRGVDVLS